MEEQILFSQLTPYLQEGIKFVSVAAAGGLIGNRVDSWFMSLFYHQRKQLVEWLDKWNPQLKDIENVTRSEPIRLLFSKAVSDISNEIDPEKLKLWPYITDSIVRNDKIPINKKQVFISIFNRLDTFALQYLAELSSKTRLHANDVFDPKGKEPEDGSMEQIYYLGQIQCSNTGLTKIDHESSSFELTRMGKEFLSFISHSSLIKAET